MSAVQKTTILVVDDDSIIRKVIERVLGEEYQVIEAIDGQDGLQKARAVMPAAIIADVQMPNLNGFALCQAIKDDFEISDIPVMLMSAAENTDELLKVYDVGGEGFITKPVNQRAKLSRFPG
jgi:CheY-like chemotaxis protein